ncbi:MAG TPA: PAS domain-containing protein [Mucilaginibacter sp.]|jgi:PAS domain S-box-containing protein
MKPSSKFLNSIFEIAHVEFQTYDLNNHRLIFSSGLGPKLLGYTTAEYKELSNDFYANLVHPDDRQTVLETMDNVRNASNGEIVEMTVRLRKRDGNYLWVYSRQMILEKNRQNGHCTIIRESEDITEFVKLQDELKQKVEVLQTISYKNSHLLRNPVASIIGLVNMVEEKGITSDHNLQLFHYLKLAIEKLDAVIHEINDIANTN